MVEPLSNPLNDRVRNEIEPPPHRPMPTELLFHNGPNRPPHFPTLKNHLRKEGRISKMDAINIIRQATEVFRKEKNLLELNYEVTIVGDLHGQFHDLLKLLDMVGDLSSKKLIFLGDYVDRGSYSVEVLLTLYTLKLTFPANFYLIRGNHECRQMTAYFNFRSECLYKFDQEFYDIVCESFDTLPLACLVNKKFLAVHAGISPELTTLDNISKANRFLEPPQGGLVCDLLWSDPVDNETGECEEKFKSNEVRGCSYFFGKNAVSTFLKRNKLLSLIRAHEVQLEGYKMHNWNGPGNFPLVITIFSAPNYCDMYNNKGAVINFNAGSDLDVQQFNYSGHPYLLPDFKDLFSWSIPFVIEKILDIMKNIFTPIQDTVEVAVQDSGQKVEELKSNIRESKIGTLRKKVKAMSRMMKMFKTIREEEEVIMQLKGLCPDQKIPRGLIQMGKKALEDALDGFMNAKSLDLINEKRPPSAQ